MTTKAASNEDVVHTPAHPIYAWTPAGKPGAWGSAGLPSYLAPVGERSVYATSATAVAPMDALDAELATWRAAGMSTLAQLDDLIDSLEDVDEAE
jgi:hypothetical protein